MIPFEEFYKNYGLKTYPFTTFTTELEKEKAKELFVPMTEFGPIIEAFNDKTSMIILGERGVGKTAVLEEFNRKINKHRVFTVINEFSRFSIIPTSEEIYNHIIQSLTIAFVRYLKKHPIKSALINKRNKIFLSYLVYYYSNEVTINLIKETIEKLQISLPVRILSKIYNIIRKPLNYAGTVLESGIKRYIAQNFNMVPFYDERQIHEYFPELILTSDKSFKDRESSLKIIKELSSIVILTTKYKPIVLFDKLDEDSRLNNDAEIIGNFIMPILTDNYLLSLDSLQTILFIWKTPYRYIEDKVRSQKYYCPTLKWNNKDLEVVLNKRLNVYSENNQIVCRTLFNRLSDDEYDDIFEISNGIPRDLWHLINKIFEEQNKINPNQNTFCIESVNQAKTRFVVEFNYYEYYPRKSTSRADSMDIYSYYAHLLKVGESTFSKNMLSEKAKTGSSTSNYVAGMERIGLIERIHQERGEIFYRIKDKKIIYALNNKLDIRNK